MTDDDLRFGDVSGTNNENESEQDDIVDPFITIAKALIMSYVVLVILEMLFNVPIPFI